MSYNNPNYIKSSIIDAINTTWQVLEKEGWITLRRCSYMSADCKYYKLAKYNLKQFETFFETIWNNFVSTRHDTGYLCYIGM